VALPDIDSSVGHSFGLEVDSAFTTRIAEVTGLKMERDVVEIKEQGPDGTYIVRKLPGRWKTPEITLTRGLTAEASFTNWVKESQLAPTEPVSRNGAVTVFDLSGAVIKKYRFTKAWPKSLETVATPDADGKPILSERLVLVCERIEPE
jgi:phage tail-like protein